MVFMISDRDYFFNNNFNQDSRPQQAFLVDGARFKRNSQSNPDVFEATLIAEANRGVVFDCLCLYSGKHTITFLNQFSEENEKKRMAYHILNIFMGSLNVDILVQMLFIDAYKIYKLEVPHWLRDLSSARIGQTREFYEKELKGFENLQIEFDGVKRKFLACGNKLARKQFKLFLKDNPTITKIYGFIGQISLYLLEWKAKVIDHTDTERHYLYHFDGREIEIHLFGSDDQETISTERSTFARKQRLRLPYVHYDDEIRVERTEEEIHKAFIENAWNQFKEWWEYHYHPEEATDELLAWLHEDQNCLINTYYDFLKLCWHAKENGLNLTTMPRMKAFDAAICLRQAKINQGRQNTKMFKRDIWEVRFWTAQKNYELWMQGLQCTLQMEETFPEDKQLQVSFYEACCTALQHIYSSRQRSVKDGGQEFLPPEFFSKQRDELIISSLNNIRKNYTLSLLDLLHHSDGSLSSTELSDGIKKYLDIIRLSEEACEKFLRRELGLFNPIVGENLCQIRAALFAEMLNNPNIDTMVGNTLRRLIKHKEQANDLLKKVPIQKGQISSLQDFMGAIYFDIHQEVAVIISSYVLTEAKVVEYRRNKFEVSSFYESLSPESLAIKKRISIAFAKALIKAAQTKLSEFSVIYVQRIAMRLLSHPEQRVHALLAYNHVKEDEKHRKIVPFYPTMRLLLNELYTNNVPLLIRIEQHVKGQERPYGLLTMAYTNQGGQIYSVMDEPESLFGQFAVIFNAKSVTERHQSTEELKNQFLADPVEMWIYRASADHPHFKPSEKMLQDPSYQLYHQEAHTKGACHENPSVFMVQHVSCDRVAANYL